jgi:succinate dehydrogenase / fumarate reductase cytochrome b subunit
MANYILFDKLVEEGSSLISSAKELFKLIELDISYTDSFKQDTGLKTKAFNENKFHGINAYNINLASLAGEDIVCVENSSFLSLSLSKKALQDNPKLKAAIELDLKQELNLSANIVHINELLLQSVGLEKIQSLAKSSFENFNVAVFDGASAIRLEQFTSLSTNETLLSAINANIVKTSTCKNSDGYEILDFNASITDSLAGVFLLDAFDNAADFVLANDITTFKIFDARQKSIAKKVGRDIDLPILNIVQVLLLAFGEKDKKKLGFDTHKVNVTLL